MEESQVQLYGTRTSPFVHAVIWALKLKGVKYEFKEEDLSNKSSALLNYNPIYKKVPVLVHGGKPVAESAVILQYIEEAWPDRTPLLSKDPYDRAMARFWIDFLHQKAPVMYAFFLSTEATREKAAQDVLETLKTIEEKALGDHKFFGGDALSLVDLSFGWLSRWFMCIQQIAGVEVLNRDTLPRLYDWTLSFKQEPVVKENIPDGALLLSGYKKMRQMFLTANI